MRAIGLGAILLGVLAFAYPWIHQYVPAVRMTVDQSRITGGLLVAVGALTLAVFRER